jgi:hypothetical protein
MKIVRVAKSCKDIEDLRSILERFLNEVRQLEFGNMGISLDMNRDALHQMIERNCFPPIDQWRCPICLKEINTIEEDEKANGKYI